jgi:hypothetical protein
MADTITNPHADQANMSIEAEANYFVELCVDVAKLEVNADVAPRLRALQAEELKLRKKLEAAHKTEKEPHLRAGQEVDAKYKPLITKIGAAVASVTTLLTKYMEAERERQRQAAEAARKAAEEEARKAAELAAQAEAEEDPFEAFETTQAANTAQAEAAALKRKLLLTSRIFTSSAAVIGSSYFFGCWCD